MLTIKFIIVMDVYCLEQDGLLAVFPRSSILQRDSVYCTCMKALEQS